MENDSVISVYSLNGQRPGFLGLALALQGRSIPVTNR
jgi:hypothetical protein